MNFKLILLPRSLLLVDIHRNLHIRCSKITLTAFLSLIAYGIEPYTEKNRRYQNGALRASFDGPQNSILWGTILVPFYQRALILPIYRCPFGGAHCHKGTVWCLFSLLIMFMKQYPWAPK